MRTSPPKSRMGLAAPCATRPTQTKGMDPSSYSKGLLRACQFGFQGRLRNRTVEGIVGLPDIILHIVILSKDIRAIIHYRFSVDGVLRAAYVIPDPI